MNKIAPDCNTINFPKMNTIKATAKLFGLSENFVRQKVLNGEIVAVCAGRKYLVNADKFAEYLNTNTIKAAPPSENTACGITPIPADLK